MKVEIDREADVLYIRWGVSKKPPTSKEIAHGIFLELNEADEAIGIEVLSLSSRMPEDVLEHVNVDIRQAPHEHQEAVVEKRGFGALRGILGHISDDSVTLQHKIKDLWKPDAN